MAHLVKWIAWITQFHTIIMQKEVEMRCDEILQLGLTLTATLRDKYYAFEYDNNAEQYTV